MGTDIDMYLERKIEGKWHLVNKIECRRNYAFFGKLAGVRRPPHFEEKIISNNRGFPKDMSDAARALFREVGGHSEGYCSIGEFREVYEWCLEEFDGTSPFSFDDIEYNIIDEPENARVVFWFDC